MMYCAPIWEFVPPMSDAATPATPARPDPTKKVRRSTLRVETPVVSARSRLCTVARMRRPNEVYLSQADSAATQTVASRMVNSCRSGQP